MNWIWRTQEDDPVFEATYAKYARRNIHGLLFEFDDESHYQAAKSNNLEAHRWIWTLNDKDLEHAVMHPEWYAVNRNGESCVDKPPYVAYYRWLCPNQPGVVAHLKDKVREILRKDYVDGIHLDYIRYCDVVLPLNLWSRYGIVQTSELGQYDYCYCELCRNKFRRINGADPLDVEFPDQDLSWRKFRYDSITALVNDLSSVAHEHNKRITAAVFPTPEVARRLVRQDWTNWDLDSVFPMIYHGFYKEGINWIGHAVEEGVRSLPDRLPLYAGLFIPDFKNIRELKDGMRLALSKGAAGISLFGKVDDDILKLISSF